MDEARRHSIRVYQDTVAHVRAMVTAQVLQVWDSSPAMRDSDVQRLLELVVPRVQAGQLQVANLTSAHLASQAAQLGLNPDPAPVDYADVTAPRGIDPHTVYRRPAQTVWWELSKGAAYSAALAKGRTRIEQIVGIDLQLAKTHQSRASAQASGAMYWRRTLTGRENCALCIIASTQHYHTGDLLPIHGGCDCGVALLPENQSRWQALDGSWRVIDQDLLEATHEQVAKIVGDADRSAAGYKNLILTVDHGEYGPVLAWKRTLGGGPVKPKPATVPKPVPKSKVKPGKPVNPAPGTKIGAIIAGDLPEPGYVGPVGAWPDGKPQRLGGVRPFASLVETPRIQGDTSFAVQVAQTNPLLGKQARWPDVWHRQGDDLRYAREPYNVNCVRASFALVLRRMGFDVQAGAGTYLPASGAVGNSGDALRRWRAADGTPGRFTYGIIPGRLKATNLRARRVMEAEPEGAFGVVTCAWKGWEAGAHIWCWEIRDGKLLFWDGQTGKQVSVKAIIAEAKEGTMGYARLDDLNPTDEILEVISIPEPPRPKSEVNKAHANLR